jgi:hypothetical protein
MSTETGTDAPRRRRFLAAVAAGAGMIGLIVELPFFLASGLLAPLWAVAGLLAVWAALFAAAVYLARRRSFWVLALPVAAIG